MEKINLKEPVNIDFKCCFFGAIRGEKKDGKLVGLISHAYLHRNSFSHKDFECSFYESLPASDVDTSAVSFNDPEVWKLSQPEEVFKKREEIIGQYKKENRHIEYVDVLERDC